MVRSRHRGRIVGVFAQPDGVGRAGQHLRPGLVVEALRPIECPVPQRGIHAGEVVDDVAAAQDQDATFT